MNIDHIVTTSWDDGCVLDKKLVSLLNKYNLKGTFYIQKIDTEKIFTEQESSEIRFCGVNLQSLKMEDILEIDKIHEIGAHTLTHPKLTQVSIKLAADEIKGSKYFIENMLGHEIGMFCYPAGDYNEDIKHLVNDSGFLGARTVNRGVIGYPEDFFEFHTTIHVFPRPVNINFRKKIYSLPLKWIFSWESQAKRSFDHFLRKGCIWHLWGHSWEIEKFGMWDSLESIMKYISNRQGIRYLTNQDCLKYID